MALQRSMSDLSVSSTSITQPNKVTSFTTLEGTYTLRDEIKFDIPPNPYIGTKVSLLSIKSNEAALRTKISADYEAGMTSPQSPGIPPTPSPLSSLLPSISALTSSTVGTPDSGSMPTAQTAQTNASESVLEKSTSFFTGKNKLAKPKKPSISKPSSTFVHRIVACDQLAKYLLRPAESTYLFLNVGRTFLWADYSCLIKESLTCIDFKDAFVTCHDVNSLTREETDTVIGFNTGDVAWYSPLTGKFLRINKQGVMNKSPGSENLFMAGYVDGSVIIYDKDKEDQAFTYPAYDGTNFTVHKPAKASKLNPVSVWSMSKAAITSLSFSPDCQHVAITSMDGKLQIVDYLSERVTDIYQSYFGSLLCSAWSPDGKFILTGGQDDLVTVFAFRGKIVARCQGHSSWVTSLAFDAYNCTERSYRFGSVAEDAKLCMWDFSVGSLHRPKASGTLRRPKGDGDKGTAAVIHPLTPLKEVSVLEPFLSPDTPIPKDQLRQHLVSLFGVDHPLLVSLGMRWWRSGVERSKREVDLMEVDAGGVGDKTVEKRMRVLQKAFWMRGMCSVLADGAQDASSMRAAWGEALAAMKGQQELQLCIQLNQAVVDLRSKVDNIGTNPFHPLMNTLQTIHPQTFTTILVTLTCAHNSAIFDVKASPYTRTPLTRLISRVSDALPILDSLLFPMSPKRIDNVLALGATGRSLELIKKSLTLSDRLFNGDAGSALLSFNVNQSLSIPDKDVAKILNELLDKVYDPEIIAFSDADPEFQGRSKNGINIKLLDLFKDIAVKIVWVACTSTLLRWSRTVPPPGDKLHPILQLVDRVMHLIPKINDTAALIKGQEINVRKSLAVLSFQSPSAVLVTLTLMGLALTKSKRSVGFGGDDDYMSVQRQLEEALKRSGVDIPECWSVLGYMKRASGDISGSMASFTKAMRLCSNPKASVLSQIGWIYFAQSSYEMSLIYYQAALDVDPTCLEALAGCSKLYCILNREGPELIMLSRLGMLPQKPIPQDLEPIRLVSRLVALQPPKAASEFFIRLQPYLSSRIFRMNPADLPPASLLRQASEIHMAAKSRRKARGAARQLLDMDAWDPVAAALLVRCAVTSGGVQWEEEPNAGEEEYCKREAKRVACKVLRLLRVVHLRAEKRSIPDSDKADMFEMESVMERHKKDASLKWLFTDDHRRKSLLAELHSNYAVLLSKTGEIPDALQQSLEALKLATDDTNICLNHCLLLHRVGDTAKAGALWLQHRLTRELYIRNLDSVAFWDLVVRGGKYSAGGKIVCRIWAINEQGSTVDGFDGVEVYPRKGTYDVKILSFIRLNM
ncbi:hypothetical protein HDV05_001733 [Chytridiales sp. JEL 0842]|nr:hypothetical protein HDV05_001733 [Chytridiales sp. JEL 0842]